MRQREIKDREKWKKNGNNSLQKDERNMERDEGER